MKNKLVVLLTLGLAMSITGSLYAAATVRGAKGFGRINQSATAVLACKGPAAVYSVVASTGATSDFVILRDSNTANTTSAEYVRIPLSATLLTNVTFDPPLQFRNGVSANGQATTANTLVTCETGVLAQGN